VYIYYNILLCACAFVDFDIQLNSTYPDTGYLDHHGPSGTTVQNSTKLTCLEISGYRI
jgi:hypothetical protein